MNIQILINGTDSSGNDINENFDDIEDALEYLEGLDLGK